MGRLKNLQQNLQSNQELLRTTITKVIQEQLAEWVVKKFNDQTNCGQQEFYFPHKELFVKMLQVQNCEL